MKVSQARSSHSMCPMYVSPLLSQACHWQGNRDQNRGMIPLKVCQAPALAIRSHAFFPHRMDSPNLAQSCFCPLLCSLLCVTSTMSLSFLICQQVIAVSSDMVGTQDRATTSPGRHGEGLQSHHPNWALRVKQGLSQPLRVARPSCGRGSSYCRPVI